MPRILVLLLLAAFSLAAAERLYLKDGTWHTVREYEVKSDRVRYYSTERSDWEEIPLELVDLARTRKEVADLKGQVEADAKADAEERAAEKAAKKQVTSVPKELGAYYLRGDKLEAIKQIESKLVADKKRRILKAISPIPLVPGKATVEIDGEHAALITAENRPEFYFRIDAYEYFEIIRLKPSKKMDRIAWNVSILDIKQEHIVDEVMDKIESFKKQEADGLYKMWPQKPLDPGEYAIVQYTEGKLDPQFWDFRIQ